MSRLSWILVAVLTASSLAACGDDDGAADTGVVDGGGDADAMDSGPPDPPAPAPLDGVDQTARRVIPGLSGHAYVVRVEHNAPHVYAENREDAWRVFGFVMAQDRFFQMDLTSRLSTGTLTEILGDAALETDFENRFNGAARVTDLAVAALSPEEAAEVDAFAEGINAYLDGVRNLRIVAPRELQLASLIFGLPNVNSLLVDWDRRSVMGAISSLLYGTSFETGDVRRTSAMESVSSLFEGFPDRALRQAGLQADIIDHYAPPNASQSAAGWGLDTAGSVAAPLIGPRPARPTPLDVVVPERTVIERLESHLTHFNTLRGRDENEGYGSNVWAIMGSATADGRAILASDGHLSLTTPSLFWSIGIDTQLMGAAAGEDTRIVGTTLPGLPVVGVGTNGRVAWGLTAYFADVTDWYTEELVLDAAGMPQGAIFEGTERPLVRVDEVYEIANVDALGSVGRTETIPRFQTFDGRMINSIEGRVVTADETLAPGETRLNIMGDLIVPGDEDGDGVISAVSFYYGPFDGGTILHGFRGFESADTAEDFRQSMRHFIGYAGSFAAADREGSVMYSGYHAVPCRDYLPRDAGTNVWIAGADPRRLIDGTQYGAWSIPLDAQGRVDEAAAAAGGPTACAVPFDQWPQALNPAKQYVHHANNDPGGIATDNDIFDDPYYIGGPWIEGYRAARIEELVQGAIADGTANLELMQDMQADHHSNLGEDFASILVEAIDEARTAAAGTPAAGSPEARLAARWAAASADYIAIEGRMAAWTSAGFPTPSGVETFYNVVQPGDVASSVATTLFHSWFSQYTNLVMNDEGISSKLSPAVTGDTYRLSTIDILLRGRGAGNPLSLGSWNPATEESVFFDDVTTAEVESSHEIAIRALDEALAYLRSDPTAPGVGGYGSTDMDDYIWGLRHMVRFDSLLGDFLGDDPSYGPLVEEFRITPERLPLADGITAGDPRFELPYFPRPGDQLEIDSANPGFNLRDWTHGSGAVSRMVITLGADGVTGENIIPGGQSGLPASPYFDDQTVKWLANETTPMRMTPDEVVAGAIGLERFAPE
ncbi:MAG: hypothetical protein DRJ42_18090 [Deltaproteobacteria bacterium]|nr:MAG: hypothetical protein DRJ42_18090 [Deltaproteobacteria bacterium]